MKIAATGATGTEKSNKFTNGLKNSKVVRAAGRGLEAGAVTVGLNYLIFPRSVKSGIRTMIAGEDKFISKTVKQAGKAAKKAGESINAEAVAENAKNVFPEIVKNAKTATETLGKAFAGVAAGVFVGNLISDMIIDKHVNNK